MKPLRRHRRGGVLVESALVFPILATLLCGILDWGWYFFLTSKVLDATKDASRVAAAASAGEDPRTLAETQARAILEDVGILRWASPTVEGTVGSTGGLRTLKLSLTLPFEPLVGLVPTPADIRAERTIMLEKQDLGYYGL